MLPDIREAKGRFSRRQYNHLNQKSAHIDWADFCKGAIDVRSPVFNKVIHKWVCISIQANFI
jgi:hypothetical protein